MNLKTEDLKNILFKYISSQQKKPSISCPPLETILRAIKSPSKKTRKIMNHILDCNECLPLFLFLKELLQAEEFWLNSMRNSYSLKSKFEVKRKIPLLRLPLLKLTPYAAIIMLISVLLFTSIKYFNFSKDSISRSPLPELSLILVKNGSAEASCPYYLKWNSLPRAKSYLIQIFDASLFCLWHQTSQETFLFLPTDICDRIKSGQRLIIYFEAQEEEGRIAFTWFGDFSSLKIISEGREWKGHLR